MKEKMIENKVTRSAKTTLSLPARDGAANFTKFYTRLGEAAEAYAEKDKVRNYKSSFRADISGDRVTVDVFLIARLFEKGRSTVFKRHLREIWHGDVLFSHTVVDSREL